MRGGVEGEGSDMKRVLRWVFNVATVVSALLFVATCVLWVRSYWVSDKLHWSRFYDGQPYDGKIGWVDVWAVRGRVGVYLNTNCAFLDDWPRRLRHEVESLDFAEAIEVGGPEPSGLFGGGSGLFGGRPGLYHVYLDRAGLAYWRSDRDAAHQGHHGIAPVWFLAALTGVGPLVALSSVARRWRRGRKRPGLCTACGYDLRATPDRCPECGAVPPGKVAR